MLAVLYNKSCKEQNPSSIVTPNCNAAKCKRKPAMKSMVRKTDLPDDIARLASQ